jgi:hypothetical protein
MKDLWDKEKPFFRNDTPVRNWVGVIIIVGSATLIYWVVDQHNLVPSGY